jgi:hypothetical protein
MSYYATPRDQWPTRVEAAHEPPLTPLPADDRATLTAQLAALQHTTVRCDTWSCRTTVNLNDDPAAHCDRCGETTCDMCEHACGAIL